MNKLLRKQHVITLESYKLNLLGKNGLILIKLLLCSFMSAKILAEPAEVDRPI